MSEISQAGVCWKPINAFVCLHFMCMRVYVHVHVCMQGGGGQVYVCIPQVPRWSRFQQFLAHFAHTVCVHVCPYMCVCVRGVIWTYCGLPLSSDHPQGLRTYLRHCMYVCVQQNKTKKQKKNRPTYPNFQWPVTPSHQFFFLGLTYDNIFLLKIEFKSRVHCQTFRSATSYSLCIYFLSSCTRAESSCKIVYTNEVVMRNETRQRKISWRFFSSFSTWFWAVNQLEITHGIHKTSCYCRTRFSFATLMTVVISLV